MKRIMLLSGTALVMASIPVDQTLQAGISAVQEGDKAQARTLLLQVVEQDDRIEQAWYWLSLAVEDAEDKILALENVLVLNPEHEVAQSNLDWWRQRVRYEREDHSARRATVEPVQELLADPGTPSSSEDQSDSSGIFAAATHSSIQLATEPTLDLGTPFLLSKDEEAEPEYATALGRDGAYDPNQCIYCGYLAAFEDRRCPDCKRKLVTPRERTRIASGYLKSGRVVLILLAALAVFEFLLTYYIVRTPGESLNLALDFMTNFIGYRLVFGDIISLDAPVVVALLGAHTLRVLLYIVVLVGLFVRLNFSFYLSILLLAVEVLFAGYRFTNEFSGLGLLIISVTLGLLGLYLLFASERDFDVAEERVRCEPDKAAKSAKELSRRGYKFSQEGKWGLAVSHFQGAVATMPDELQLYKQLALGYAQIGRYRRALRALEEAQRRQPQDTDAAELIAMVKDQQANDPKRGGEWWIEI